MLAESPFAGKGEDKFVHVHFLAGQPTKAQFEQLMADQEGRGPEKLAPGTRALHIDFVDGVGTSKLTSAFIEKRLGCKGTARNVRSKSNGSSRSCRLIAQRASTPEQQSVRVLKVGERCGILCPSCLPAARRMTTS